MITRVIAWSTRNRGLVLLGALALFVIPTLFLLWHGRHLSTAPTRFTNDRKRLNV